MVWVPQLVVRLLLLISSHGIHIRQALQTLALVLIMCLSVINSGDYVPGLWLDGMDVIASKRGFQFAIDHCRSGTTFLMHACIHLA